MSDLNQSIRRPILEKAKKSNSSGINLIVYGVHFFGYAEKNSSLKLHKIGSDRKDQNPMSQRCRVRPVLNKYYLTVQFD